jgi:hypothetical protein
MVGFRVGHRPDQTSGFLADTGCWDSVELESVGLQRWAEVERVPVIAWPKISLGVLKMGICFQSRDGVARASHQKRTEGRERRSKVVQQLASVLVHFYGSGIRLR